MPRFSNFNELPKEHTCNICDKTKPLSEMVLRFLRKEKLYNLRPRCKDCHNQKERGYRREYKREYLKTWRKNNAKTNRSYWNNDEARERARINALRRFNEKHEAILIQGRFARRGMNITLVEAEEYLAKFGRCYPSAQGLTTKGLKEFERIRSRLRSRKGKMPTSFHIRLMVYEDDEGEYKLVIHPDKQPKPYQSASENLKNWHKEKRKRNELSARN